MSDYFFQVRQELKKLGYNPKRRNDLAVQHEHLIYTNEERGIPADKTALLIDFQAFNAFRLPKHIRIWIWFKGGPVRISLKDGQSITFGYCEPHEEGYSGTSVTISRSGFEMTRHWCDFGRDCDGPLSHDGVQTWGALNGEFMSWPWDAADDGSIRFPAWTEYEPTRVNDAFAQAAGY